MGKSRKVLLLGSDGIGRGDQDLGFEILMSMLKSLLKSEELPEAMVFWNTGVRLLAEGLPSAPLLKALEEKGVQLLAGQLCVSELELTGKMVAGRLASMDEILNLMLRSEVVSL